jgi:uncharacterized protein (DUF2236 family)
MAEVQGHHPDLYLAWGKVRVEVWTHKISTRVLHGVRGKKPATLPRPLERGALCLTAGVFVAPPSVDHNGNKHRQDQHPGDQRAGYRKEL